MFLGLILRPLRQKPLEAARRAFSKFRTFSFSSYREQTKAKKRGGGKTGRAKEHMPTAIPRDRGKGKPSFEPAHPDFRRQATASLFHILSNGLAMHDS